AHSSKRGVTVSPRVKRGQNPCRRFVPHRRTPFAATTSPELRNAGSSDNDELRRPAIATKQRPNAAAGRHLCGNCNPGCDHAGVRGTSLVAVPLWTALVQGWRVEAISDPCGLTDPSARLDCFERLRIGEPRHPAKGANAPIRLHPPEQKSE